MTDNINPSHYKDGPFECIELSRLLSSDWGQAVQYCFRWQHKNGVEDLKKALWFINDAITHNVPFFAACCKRNADILEAQAIRLLSILQAENWADLGSDRHLINMWALEELLNDGWKIVRVDAMSPTELPDNAVSATNVYILEKQSEDAK